MRPIIKSTMMTTTTNPNAPLRRIPSPAVRSGQVRSGQNDADQHQDQNDQQDGSNLMSFSPGERGDSVRRC
jgi:hypothetical protein